MKPDDQVHELEVLGHVGNSRDRQDFGGEEQPSFLRDCIKTAYSPEGREELRERLSGVQRKLKQLEEGFEGSSPFFQLESSVLDWCRLHWELGDILCSLAKYDKGAEHATFSKAIEHLEKAAKAPIGTDDGYLWSFAHNDKGAAHYWFSMWLTGDPRRKVMDEVDPGRLDQCVTEMYFSLHHYECALFVRERLESAQRLRSLGNRAGMLAQTYQNIGTAQTHLAWWTKDLELAKKAPTTLGLVSSTLSTEEVKRDFPNLFDDSAEAQSVLLKLTTAAKTCDKVDGSVFRVDAGKHDGVGVKNISRKGGSEEKVEGDGGYESSLCDAFQESVMNARGAVDTVAERLQDRLDRSRRFVPSETEERQTLVDNVKAAFELGVKVSVQGELVGSLLLQRGQTLTWKTKKGAFLGFRKNSVQVSGPRCDVADM